MPPRVTTKVARFKMVWYTFEFNDEKAVRLWLSTIQGLSVEHDILEAIFKTFKKEFACNGNVIEHSEYGKVLQLQGDQRTKVCAWLSDPKKGLVRADQLKMHGF